MKDFNAQKYVDEWLAIGLSTEPADFDEAEAAVRDILKFCEIDITQINRAVSPDAIKNTSDILFGGAWSAGWCANVNCLVEEFDWNGDTLPRFRMEERLAKSCFLVEWGEDFVTIIDRPEAIRMQDNVLHCENGPAIVFRDGWSVYSWRGTRVPKEWIEGKPSVTDAINHENVEMRRCAAEIIGWNVVLEELNARSIDKNENPMIGEVLEVDLPDIGTERFLRVMCGTKREFALPIPPDIGDARSAQAWLNQEDELPAFRT